MIVRSKWSVAMTFIVADEANSSYELPVQNHIGELEVQTC